MLTFDFFLDQLVFLGAAGFALAVAWVLFRAAVPARRTSPAARLAEGLGLREAARDPERGVRVWAETVDGEPLGLQEWEAGRPAPGGLRRADEAAYLRLPGLPHGVRWGRGKGPGIALLDDPPVWASAQADDPVDDAVVLERAAPLLLPEVRAALAEIPAGVALGGEGGELWVDVTDVGAAVIEPARRLSTQLEALPDVAAGLQAVALGDGPVPVRCAALVLLARRYPGVHAFLALNPAPPDPDPTVRGLTDWLSGRPGDHAAMGQAHLDVLPVWAWRLLVEGLAEDASAVVLRPLLARARRVPDAEVAGIGWYRSLAGDPAVWPALAPELAAATPEVATMVLGFPLLHRPEGAPLVRAALGHRDAAVRAAATAWLARHEAAPAPA